MRVRGNIVLILFFLSLQVFTQVREDNSISGHYENISLGSILDSLSEQTDYFFSYNTVILESAGKFTITAENEPIDAFLSRLLVGTGLEYSFFKDQIILNYKEKEEVNKKKNQFNISGKVIDEQGKPLRNVSVFLDGTSLGAATDIDGNYKLESIPAGYFDLVFSHIGYENAIYPISENNGGARIQNHQMQLDLKELDEVEVVANRITSKEAEWLLYFIVFRDELLGNSENAKSCTIDNPEVLRFTYDKNNESLKAFASDPIQITNNALGYSITYFLESFEKKQGDLRYRGQIRFRNSSTQKNYEKKSWNRNRVKSFNGSFNHFKKSLLSNRLKKDGFRIYYLNKLSDLDTYIKLSRLSASDVIVFKGDHFELDFKDNLLIEYFKEKENVDFLTDPEYSSILYKRYITNGGTINRDPGYQLSIIKLLKKSVRLDLNGQVKDKFAITTFGYWSWERLADLVPINYDPKLDKL